MCYNHQTYHTCGHTSTDITLCLTAIKPIVYRAKTWPYLDALPAIATATHETITSASTSPSDCRACTVPAYETIMSKARAFFQETGAANVAAKESKSMDNGVSLHLETDADWIKKMEEILSKAQEQKTAKPSSNTSDPLLSLQPHQFNNIAEKYTATDPVTGQRTVLIGQVSSNSETPTDKGKTKTLLVKAKL